MPHLHRDFKIAIAVGAAMVALGTLTLVLFDESNPDLGAFLILLISIAGGCTIGATVGEDL